jgi:hypothetical protein
MAGSNNSARAKRSCFRFLEPLFGLSLVKGLKSDISRHELTTAMQSAAADARRHPKAWPGFHRTKQPGTNSALILMTPNFDIIRKSIAAAATERQAQGE